MRRAVRVVMAAAVALSAAGCGGGGGTASLEVPEGGVSPEQAGETFLTGATDATRHRAAGAFTDADRDYQRMASVFGTENGSVYRSMSAEEARNRMIVLSACFRPVSYRIIAESDVTSRSAGQTSVTAEVDRGEDTLVLPFSVVSGRGERWFIDRIDMTDVIC